MAKEELSAVEVLTRAMQSSPQRVEYLELAYEFIKQMGGMQAMALQMCTEWRAAKPGSLARQRLMASILDVLRRGQDKIKASDVSDMSDEELDDNIKRIMVAVGAIHDAQKAGEQAVEEASSGG